MFAFLSNFFQKEGIDFWAPIPLSECTVIKPYLLEREKMNRGSAIIFCIPYFTKACLDPDRNVSAYAVSRDYHLYCKDLFARLLQALRDRFPQYKFAAFADHSPIAEVEAAAKAGLGVIGKNHLLLTKKCSSYIFIGELITDADLPCKVGKPEGCIGCGLCLKSCPAASVQECLSALTQKKGELTDEEKQKLLNHPLVWGCDICQEVCPYTRDAIQQETIFSPIPFFQEETVSHLTYHAVESMSDETFSQRAYSWRGKNTLLRNLSLKENKGDPIC